MTFYAENIHGETQFDDDTHPVCGVYLHGKLEKLNGYDIVEQFHKDPELIKKDSEFIEKVEVIFSDGSKHNAIAYIWKSPSQYEITKCSPYPVCKEREMIHGLICAIDDDEANAYALQKFNSRAKFI